MARSREATRAATVKAPAAPTHLAATRVSDGQVIVSWKPPTSWGGAKPASYVIQMSHANRKGLSRNTVPAGSASATLNDLYDGIPLKLTVAAKNSAGKAGPASAAVTADPSPSVAVNSTLKLTSSPKSSACTDWQLYVDECFSFQQNFFVTPENAPPGSHPVMFIQNVILFEYAEGFWDAYDEAAVFDLSQSASTPIAAPTYLGSLGAVSFPAQFTLTTKVGHDSVSFYNSASQSQPFYTYTESSDEAASHPFSVVFNPHVGLDYYDPQAMLVGPDGGLSVAFQSGTAGSLVGWDTLQDGAIQTGASCLVSNPHSSTQETSQNLGWKTSSLGLWSYQFASASSSPEGITFLPDKLGCAAGGPIRSAQRFAQPPAPHGAALGRAPRAT